MTLKDIIKKVKWEDLEKFIIETYCDNDIEDTNLAGLQLVFNELHFIEPKEKPNWRICLKTVHPDPSSPFYNIDDKEYVDVHAKNGTLQKESSDIEYWRDTATEEFLNSEATFAIEFTPWNECLGFNIDAETINTYSDVEIVAHCIWEMTYISYNQDDIKERIDELSGRVEKLSNMSDDELKANTFTLDELKEKLRKDLNKD